MNVKEIIKEYLEKNNYDGLFSDDCCCDIEDLMCCFVECIELCEPGIKMPCTPSECPEGGGCGYHIGERK